MSVDKGVFSNVEKNRRDKYEIKRRDKYLYLGILAVLVGMLSIALSKSKEFSRDFFLIDFNKLFNQKGLDSLDFQGEYYLAFFIVATLFWYGLIIKKPLFKKDGLMRKLFYIIFLPFNLMYKFYLFVLRKLDPKKKEDKDDTLFRALSKLIYMPYNFLTFTHEETKPFEFQPCWLGKLEKDFFKQAHNKVDNIIRVTDLAILKDFHLVFTDNEYKKLIRLFKSEDAFNDYLKITEGYLTESGKRKFDELFHSNKKSVLKNFRAFNDRDKVYFSIDFILYKVDEQSKVFEKFLTERFLRGTTRVNAEILNYFKYTINDKNFTYNIVGVTKEDLNGNKYSKEEKKLLQSEISKVKAALENDDLTYIENLIKERLVIWFKFFFGRTIMQRYCNIPSGLLVARVEDYTMRMITEVYIDKKLVNIAKNQNDGSSNSFKGDGLTNLFLYVWNVFLHGRKTKILDELAFNINTISDNTNMYDGDIQELVKNMEKEIDEHKKITKNK